MNNFLCESPTPTLAAYMAAGAIFFRVPVDDMHAASLPVGLYFNGHWPHMRSESVETLEEVLAEMAAKGPLPMPPGSAN